MTTQDWIYIAAHLAVIIVVTEIGLFLAGMKIARLEREKRNSLPAEERRRTLDGKLSAKHRGRDNSTNSH